ncbi:MAG: histidine kinase, partial [Bacteroidota bacterium]
MKRKLGMLFLWFLLVELLYSNRVDLINSFDVSGMFDWFDSFESFIQVLSGYLAFFTYSAGAYLLFFRFYPRKQYLWLSLAMIALIPSVIAFRFLLQEVIMEAILGFGNYREGIPWRVYALDNLFFGIVFTGLGVVFYLVQYSRYTESQQADLKLEQQKTELALLRAQINPHFLFNSLNNIYTLVYQQSEHALPAMEKLSGLLRYTLYEQADWVPIRKEIQSLQDFIALQTWRYPFQIDVHLSVDPQLS